MNLSSKPNSPVQTLQPCFRLLHSCIPYLLFLCPPVFDTTKSTCPQDAMRKSELEMTLHDEIGITFNDEQLATLQIAPAKFRGDWNYCIKRRLENL